MYNNRGIRSVVYSVVYPVVYPRRILVVCAYDGVTTGWLYDNGHTLVIKNERIRLWFTDGMAVTRLGE